MRDEVDNETVDDEGSSEEMPAGKSEKAAKEKEVQLEAEQTPMVKKGMHRSLGLVIMHGSSLQWQHPMLHGLLPRSFERHGGLEDFEISHKYLMQVPIWSVDGVFQFSSMPHAVCCHYKKRHQHKQLGGHI